MKSNSSGFAFLALVLCTGRAGAQNPRPPVPTSAPPQYEVEILIFAHRTFDSTEERFDETVEGLRNDPTGSPFRAPALEPAPSAASRRGAPPRQAAPAPQGAGNSLEVRRLRQDELKLSNEYRKLQAISAYQPVLHAGWVQPGLPEADAEPFDLGLLGVHNPVGTVRVHLSRFLHITLDLTYRADALAAAPVDIATELELRELTLAPRYRLTAARSARSGELHYFDHPAFGVLVRITPRPAASGTDARRPAA